MNDDDYFDQILQEAFEDGCRRCEADLREFVGPLEAWMDQLFQEPLGPDWHDQLMEYLAEQEPKGYRIEPENLWVLEEEIYLREQDRKFLAASNGRHTVPPRRSLLVQMSPPAPAPAPPAKPQPEPSKPSKEEQQQRAFRSIARAVAADEKRRLGLTEDERAEFERYMIDAQQRVAQGETPAPAPDFYQEKLAQFESRARATASQEIRSNPVSSDDKFDAKSGSQYNRSSEQEPQSDVSEAPNQFARNPSNGNPNTRISPTNATDSIRPLAVQFSTGWIWGERWSVTQKSLVTESMNRIPIRVNSMMAQLAAVRVVYASDPTLSACEKQYILQQVDTLHRVLQNVAGGITSGRRVSFYHYDFDPGIEANTFPHLWHIDLNDAASPNWMQMSPAARDALLFHELTHLYGTVDLIGSARLRNAHLLTFWYNGQDVLFNITGDRELRKEATNDCIEAAGPPPPPLGPMG